ncbi:ATP-binding protein, partial [Sulfurimonas sp. SAG-AH-194-C21]
MPVVLFIDDLQWIDEDTSEYIIDYFVKLNVHIVSSIRPSDATTSLKKAYANESLNPYKIELLLQAGIKLETEITTDIDTKKLELNTTHLQGLNKEILTELISKVIRVENNDRDRHALLAKTIIYELKNDNDKEKDEVNTLFAIETLNMLCDKKLYTSQKEEIAEFILTDIPLRFNPKIEDEDTENTLQSTFNLIKKSYEKAFEEIDANDDNSDSEFKQKFTLMAYAVLKERLKILEIYFSDHGNAAVNTLLFSSLLGTPFHSVIVKNILQRLSQTEEKLLQPLREYILEGTKEITLTEVHYEIIEEVYEILSRYVAFDNSYAYRHSLLNIFLEKQLEYQLGTVFTKEKQESRDELYKLILLEIKKEEIEQNFEIDETNKLDQLKYRYMLFLNQLKVNILEKAYANNPNMWSNDYTTVINNNMRFYYWIDNVERSIFEGERLLTILEQEEKFEKKYLLALSNLAMAHKNNNNIETALNLQKKAEDIIKNEHYYVSSDIHILILTNLATIYKYDNKLEEAIFYEEQAFELLDIQPSTQSKAHLNSYLRIISNLANSYIKTGESNNLNKAISLMDNANIIDQLYAEDKNYWIE